MEFWHANYQLCQLARTVRPGLALWTAKDAACSRLDSARMLLLGCYYCVFSARALLRCGS